MADLLLINASNYPGNVIYPYAFIQLGALARRHNISIKTLDLLSIRREDYATVISRTIEASNPSLIGFHLRQADSVNYHDYDPRNLSAKYFPLENTRYAIDIARSFSAAPIIGGGFGFSVHPRQTLAQLNLDYGIVGDGDPLFEAFNQLVLKRGIEAVPNLIHHGGDEVATNATRRYSPNEEREYRESAIRDMEQFYGVEKLYGSFQPTVAVELSRGCPFACYFCTEPSVKGRAVRQRNLDVVFEEVDFLSAQRLHNIWLVCSELNFGSDRLALELAERFLKFNEKQQIKTKWHAYHLPRWIDRSGMELLYKSGFQGGWNDFPSFDDENLRSSRVPYRKKHAVEHLVASIASRSQHGASRPATFSMFLGNAFSSPAVIRNTLDIFCELDLQRHFERGLIGSATRAFEGISVGPRIPGSDQTLTYSSNGLKRNAPEFVNPTYYFAPALLEAAGSEQNLVTFFEYAEQCFLSQEYMTKPNWASIVSNGMSKSWFEDAVRLVLNASEATSLWQLLNSAVKDVKELAGEECSNSDLIERLVQAEQGPSSPASAVLRLVCLEIAQCALRQKMEAKAHTISLSALSLLLGDASPYTCFKSLITKFPSNSVLIDEVLRECEDDEGLAEWLCEVGIQAKGLVLRTEYGRICGVVSSLAG